MLQIIDCEQNSPEWRAARCGLPTASCFGDILAKGEGKTRRTYLMKLAGEILTGEPMESFSNVHTDRGHAMEEEARNAYAFMADVDPQRVGFIRNGQKGCSPDSLIGDNGMLEIKTQLPHLLIETILKDDFPSAHKAQCQGALWCAEREWIDISVYWKKMPSFVKRAYRDVAYIGQLTRAVDEFNDELQELVRKLRARSGGMEKAA
jgi:hypothetical protein